MGIDKRKNEQNIRDAAREGHKQTWLAEKLGKSFKIVNNYTCNRSQPSLKILNEIATILYVVVKELIKKQYNE